MSDSIPSENVIRPDCLSKTIPRGRGKLQFSIRSLLLLTLIVALALTSVLMFRRMSQAETELVKLRNEAGYLTITDETVFQGIALHCDEPLTWKWRCYLPKGSKYSWSVGSGMIPKTGVPADCNASGQDMLPRPKGTEVILTVSIRKDPDPRFERWLFNLSSRTADGTLMEGTTTSIPGQIMDQIFQANMTCGECLGELKAETRKPGEMIVLVKRRIGEATSSSSWKNSSKPQPGFAAWLGEVK